MLVVGAPPSQRAFPSIPRAYGKRIHCKGMRRVSLQDYEEQFSFDVLLPASLASFAKAIVSSGLVFSLGCAFCSGSEPRLNLCPDRDKSNVSCFPLINCFKCMKTKRKHGSTGVEQQGAGLGVRLGVGCCGLVGLILRRGVHGRIRVRIFDGYSHLFLGHDLRA